MTSFHSVIFCLRSVFAGGVPPLGSCRDGTEGRSAWRRGVWCGFQCGAYAQVRLQAEICSQLSMNWWVSRIKVYHFFFFFYAPIFSSRWSRKFPPTNNLSLIIQQLPVREGEGRHMPPPRDVKSNCVCFWSAVHATSHSVHTSSQESIISYSVPVIDGGESNDIPPTQTAQSVLLSWFLATDSCGAVRVQACECHYLLRLPFQPKGIRDMQNHSMVCISHVVTGFFVALNIKYYSVLKHRRAVVRVRSSGNGVHGFGC